jgi:hypothetical protein
MELPAVPLKVPLALYFPFYAGLLAHVLPHAARLFSRRHARAHRLLGLAYLLWITVGLMQLCMSMHTLLDPLAYDLVLGALGMGLTLSAAYEFGHRNVRNEASGALDEQATITHGEMIEHSFYQGLNVAQACFLHAQRAQVGASACRSMHMHTSHATAHAAAAISTVSSHSQPALPARMALLAAVTLPWAFRSRFPINHFSDNFRGKAYSLVRLLYRLKKYQYLLDKHALLHGLNISVAFSGRSFATEGWWRLYWISLNTAYVLEFFLQVGDESQLLRSVRPR